MAKEIICTFAFNQSLGNIREVTEVLGVDRKNIKKGVERCNVATPLWPSVGVKPNTSKVEDLESFGTPECLEFDNKAQNTSY